jgi:hypothetical protein
MSENIKELNFEPPDPGLLEEKVAASIKCPKCKRPLHGAVLAQYVKSSTPGKDLDILFDLYCVVECGWTEAQWRPWSSREPEKI